MLPLCQKVFIEIKQTAESVTRIVTQAKLSLQRWHKKLTLCTFKKKYSFFAVCLPVLKQILGILSTVFWKKVNKLVASKIQKSIIVTEIMDNLMGAMTGVFWFFETAL